jgi:hypothetical protein
MPNILSLAALCNDVRRPDDLERLYREQAMVLTLRRDELTRLADIYDPFANRVAVLEEFYVGILEPEAMLASQELADRSLEMRDQAGVVAGEAEDLVRLADTLHDRYPRPRLYLKRALRAECLAVLAPSK